MTDELSFQSNLERRVQNLALGPSVPSNALVPVFEAIYNSIHAIQDRFGAEWCDNGRIHVAIHNLNTPHLSFEIRDNGIGLTDNNFVSFRTFDSGYKSTRGGKGVGRLTWLKVFENAKISSSFFANGEILARNFKLVLSNYTPIVEYTNSVSNTHIGTTVLLANMNPVYAKFIPTKSNTIVRKIIAHFLPYLISPKKPQIFVETENESIDIATFVQEREIRLGESEIKLSDGRILVLRHNLLERGIVEGTAAHRLYFSANERIVRWEDIATVLGLTTNIEKNQRAFAYAGVLSGPLLDISVNAERTAFDLEQQQLNTITRETFAAVRSVLSPQIERVIGQQTQLTQAVLKKYPLYSYLVPNPREFVDEKIPRHARSAEKIYQQLAILDFRDNREVERKIEKLHSSDHEDILEGQTKDLLNRLSNHELSMLADYTVRRKLILDLLERRLGYTPSGEMRHYAEDALHKIVVPMRIENHQIRIDSHNLWIIDDKLAYYEYWASDKSIKNIISDSESKDRPDVILFSGRSAFHRPGTDQPIVIVEFKRPARNDYNDEENPISQIYSYIDDLRGGKVLDKSGGVIQEVSDITPFFCYVIADITPKMRQWLKNYQIDVPIPGGSGFYGYNSGYKAFIYAVSYKYVLRDARLRNEGFFKQINI